MIKLPDKELYVFPEQAGLVPLLQKHVSDDGVLLDPYFCGEECDVGLYYGNENVEHDGVIVAFRHNVTPQCKKWYFTHHPLRDYLEKWNYSKWNKKTVRWSTIVDKELDFESYRHCIIERDVVNDLSDFRLAIHSLETHIPVLSEEDFCEDYYGNFHCETTNQIAVYRAFENLRQPRFNLSHDEFMYKLIHIVGRIHEKNQS